MKMRKFLFAAMAIVFAGGALAEKTAADLLADDGAILLRADERVPSLISLCRGPRSDGAQYRIYRRNADGEFIRERIIFCPNQK